MKDKIYQFFERIRKRALNRGYTCDACGKELFDYPVHRLCEECEGKLRPSKNPCPKCGREGVAEGLCTTCKALPPTFTKGISAFQYKGEGGLLVNRMKNGSPRIARYFGEKMAEKFLERMEGFQEPILLVAVPLSKGRRRERGYNQAERLAESVEEYLLNFGVEVTSDFNLLVKTRETALQKRATQKGRLENVKGAYALKNRKAFDGRTVLLIDDIMTTGTTGNECARKILSAGAKEVYFLTATAVPERK